MCTFSWEKISYRDLFLAVTQIEEVPHLCEKKAAPFSILRSGGCRLIAPLEIQNSGGLAKSVACLPSLEQRSELLYATPSSPGWLGTQLSTLPVSVVEVALMPLPRLKMKIAYGVLHAFRLGKNEQKDTFRHCPIFPSPSFFYVGRGREPSLGHASFSSSWKENGLFRNYTSASSFGICRRN